MEKKRRAKKDFNVIIVDPEKISERLTRVISDYISNTVIESKGGSNETDAIKCQTSSSETIEQLIEESKELDIS